MTKYFSNLITIVLYLLSFGSFGNFVDATFKDGFLGKHLTRAEEVEEMYDYVIVGGGTSGLTVADRLTEDPDHSVLAIEYGPFGDSSKVEIVYRPHIPNMPWLRYNITSVGTYKVAVIVGAVVGGCSAINAMAFPRGQRDDYDRWEELGGGNGGKDGWGWEGLFKYFLKASRYKEPRPEFVKEFGVKYDRRYWGSENGTGVWASWTRFQWPATKILYDAWKDIPGIEYPDDNGKGESGPMWIPASVDPATITRSYSNTAHYLPHQTRPNYHLITEHKVSKINFSASKSGKPKAESVTFVSRESGEKKTVYARKEIIVSAGSVHSPQVLQRSGVGPRKLLEEAGIEVVKELPGVGMNFQDHTSLNLGYNFTTQPWPNPDALATNATYQAEVDETWNKTQVGPYAAWGNTASVSYIAFPIIAPDIYQNLASQIENQDPSAYLPPGTHHTIVAGYKQTLRVHAKGIRSRYSSWAQIANAPTGNSALTNSHPLSRGTIMLNTSDPEGEPIVDYRAMTNPLDVQVFVEMIRLMRKYVLADGVIKQLSPVWYNPPLELTTDEEIGNWAKRVDVLLPTVYHPIGTCSKMPLEWGGVVSEDLKVHGVEGLSVADASVIPSLVGATTQQSVYAMAEKAADLIKARA